MSEYFVQDYKYFEVQQLIYNREWIDMVVLAEHCSEATVLLKSWGVLTHLSYLIEKLWVQVPWMLSWLMLIEAVKSSTATAA